MSFSAETKTALCSSFVKKDCCARALLLGLVRYSGVLSGESAGELHSKYREIVGLTETLLQRCFGIGAVSVCSRGTAGRAGLYYLTLADSDLLTVREFCRIDSAGETYADIHGTGVCPGCRAHFLRGVFLICGSITQPRRLYQMDFKPPDREASDVLTSVLESAGIKVKNGLRRGTPVLYCKESESIEDFLTLIGATKAAFAVMNTKIVKEIRNNVNRISNCEVANLEKSVEAADQQMRAISKLEAAGLLERLSPQLRATARLRLENPEASLAELAELHSPPLTKSGLNHRLQKLIAYADEESK